jgi:predicted PurR-regulated permease PerM
MKTHPLTSKNWLWVALAAVVLGIWFIMPFFGVVALAALLAFLFHSTYEKLHQRMRSGAAATLTLVYSCVVVLVPVILILVFTVIQVSQLTVQLSNSFVPLPSSVQDVVNTINGIAAPITGSGTVITGEGITSFLRTTLPGVIAGLTGIITGVIGGVPMAIIITIMYIILFYEFLVYGKKITESIVALSPFQTDITRLYLARIGLMAHAMAIGQLFIAFVIAVCAAGILAIFLNMWPYFFLLTVVFTLLNLVPLGCGILVFPIAIISMFFGPIWPAIIALVLYIFVSNLEVIIRPRIIPKSITLSPGLTMLSAFGGIAMFGLLGVVYGPIIMIIIVTSIQMYLDYYQEQTRLPWKKRANV